jgi:isoamylase
VHVRGFTKLMDEVPHGCAAPSPAWPATGHRAPEALGVTSVELLPVHAFNDERRLIDLGLANYWGYNTHRLLRAGAALQRRQRPDEFKRWSRRCTRPGWR